MIVTIVTPSLNGIRFLEECIASVRSQESDRVAVEHIVVDGGSTDGTPEFAAKQGCVVMHRDELSLYAGINKGSFHSRGDLIGTLGCDDLLLPGALAAVVDAYQRTGARWLMGGHQWLTSTGTVDVRVPPAWISAPVFAALPWSCIPHCASFFRRDLFEETGGYDPGFLYSGDYEFFARLLDRNEPFARIDRSIYAWRRHDSNLSSTRNATIRREGASVQEQFAPANRWQRGLYRWILRSYLNARNPRWFLLKRADTVRLLAGRLSR